MDDGIKVKKGKESFQTSNVLLISIAHLVHDVYTSFFAPLLPLFISKFNMSYGQSSILYVVQRIPSLFNFLIGIMAEQVKMRYLIIFAPAITTIAMSLIGVAPHFTLLAVLLFVSGTSSTLFHVPSPVMIKKVSGKRTGKGMSYYMLGGELARTLGPILVAWAVDTYGLGGTLYLMPMGITASAVLFFRFRKTNISKDFTSSKRSVKYGRIFRQYLPIFLTLAGITFFRGAMKSSLTLYLPAFLAEQGESIWIQAAALSVLQLSGAAGTFLSGRISDQIGRRTTLAIVAIVSPLLMLLFLQTTGNYRFLLLLIMGFFLVAPQSVMLAVIHDFDTKHLAFINGIYMTINFFLNSVTTLMIGSSADMISLEKTFFYAALLAFVAIPFALRIPRKQ